MDPQRWHLVVKGGWQHPDTIHVKEGRVCLSGLERLGRLAPSHGQWVLSLCDNLSAVLAFDKARSRDPALRALCRRAAATAIGCEFQWLLRYIETHRNPTDEGSREDMAPGTFRCGNLRELERLETLAGARGLAPDRLVSSAPVASAGEAHAFPISPPGVWPVAFGHD